MKNSLLMAVAVFVLVACDKMNGDLCIDKEKDTPISITTLTATISNKCFTIGNLEKKLLLFIIFGVLLTAITKYVKNQLKVL